MANGQNGERLASPRPGVDSNHVAVNLMREEIDRIDQQIVDYLQKRFSLSLAIGKAKMASNEEVGVMEWPLVAESNAELELILTVGLCPLERRVDIVQIESQLCR